MARPAGTYGGCREGEALALCHGAEAAFGADLGFSAEKNRISVCGKDMTRVLSGKQHETVHMWPLCVTLWGLLDTFGLSFRDLSADIFILSLGAGVMLYDTSGWVKGR